jgi:hypothetical protein
MTKGSRSSITTQTTAFFSSNEFKAHCDRQQILYSFSGVGAKHMNGIAERNIKTVAQWACANMLHLAQSWLQYADPKYW